MTQQEKQILLQDLCTRLPYDVKVKYFDIEYPFGSEPVILIPHLLCNRWENIHDVKPYLRPMSSMTEEEKKEFQACHCVYELHPDFQPMMCNLANELNMFDWLNVHHFDYRGLIPMGLALEAPEDMYKNE